MYTCIIHTNLINIILHIYQFNLQGRAPQLVEGLVQRPGEGGGRGGADRGL